MSSRRADLQASLALAGLGFAIAGLGACVALLARDLGEPTDRLAWLPSAFAVGLLIVAMVGPILLRTDARMAVLRAGALVCGLGAVLLAVAQGFAIALVGGLFVGLGGALMLLVVPLMLSGSHAAVRLARANAVASTASISAPLVIGAMDSLGPTGRLAMIVAVAPLVILVVVARSPAKLPHTGAVAGPGMGMGQAEKQGLGEAQGQGRADRQGQAERQRWGERQTQEEKQRLGQGEVGGAKVLVGRAFGGWLRVVLAVSVEFCFVIWAVARLLDTGLSTATAALLGSAFPIGMAVGRVIGPVNIRSLSPLLPAGLLAASGTILVSLFNAPVLVTAGLALAGLGVATLYPITLADLISTPGVSPAHLASLSAFASGTAILLAPAALAGLATVVDLRTAFLIPLPLLLALLAIRRSTQPPVVPAPPVPAGAQPEIGSP